MARTSVKNMSRNQQKAVFANLGNKPSSVSNMSARRENLMRNDLATETHQDKVDKIMRDSRLTHRQKMDRIAKLKSGGSSRSSASDVGSGSSDAKVDSPAIKLIYQKVLDKAEKRRLQRKAYLKAHPGAVFEPTKKPGVYLLKENGDTFVWKDGKKQPPTMKRNVADAKKMIATAHARRKQEKTNSMQGRANLYESAYATKGEAEDIKEYLKDKGHTDVIIFTDKTGDWNIAYNEKQDPQDDAKKYRVDVLLPSVGYEKGEWISSKPMTKTEAEALARDKKKLGFRTAKAKEIKKKDMSYKDLKKSGIKLKPNLDYDGDGVKNSKDCRPMNKKKQDLFDNALAFGYSTGKAGAKAGGKFAKKKLYESTSKGRTEKAQKKIRKIEAKRRAEEFQHEQKIKADRLEKEAKQKEAQYKKEHPSIFTRVSKSASERLSRKKSIYD